jgi:isopentenyldiphosphate isomerase
MSDSESLQVVDPETGEPTGEHVSRKELFEKQLWCRTTNIFVLNSSGQILCHQRSKNKERYPGMWSTHFGGHVTAGESFKISALKELSEEIGLQANPFQMIPWRTSRKNISRVWIRDFITVFDGDISELTIQTEELDHLQWFSINEILEKLDVEGASEIGASEQWLAGTHDFEEDYQCMRAVLTAAVDIGIFGGDYKELRNWHPPKLQPEDLV